MTQRRWSQVEGGGCSCGCSIEKTSALGFVRVEPETSYSWLWWVVAAGVGLAGYRYFQSDVKPAYKRVARRRALQDRLTSMKAEIAASKRRLAELE